MPAKTILNALLLPRLRVINCQMQTVAGIIEAVLLEFQRFAQPGRWITVLVASPRRRRLRMRMPNCACTALCWQISVPAILAGNYVARAQPIAASSWCQSAGCGGHHLLRYGTVVGRIGASANLAP